MIVCKPKAGSLFSLGIFSIGGMAGGGFSFRLILFEMQIPWYHYPSALILLPLGLVIFFRIFWSYKIVTFGKEKISVRFPFRIKSFSVTLKEINVWKEVRVNTKTGNYREIEISGGGKTISINLQEYSNYQEALKYLDKKARKSKA